MVESVFYFRYRERAWALQQVMAGIARGLIGEARYFREFVPLSPGAQGEWLAEQMRTTRQFLILHNMESITGGALAIQHTLPAAERNALRDWLSATVESSRGRTVKGPCG